MTWAHSAALTPGVREADVAGRPVVRYPCVPLVETWWAGPLVVCQFACQVIEEVHVCSRHRHRGVIALGYQDNVVVAGNKCLVKRLVNPVVAVDGVPFFPVEAKIIGFFQIGRAVVAIMTVGGPPAPTAALGDDLINDEPLRR